MTFLIFSMLRTFRMTFLMTYRMTFRFGKIHYQTVGPGKIGFYGENFIVGRLFQGNLDQQSARVFFTGDFYLFDEGISKGD